MVWKNLNTHDRVIFTVAVCALLVFLFLLYDDSLITNWSETPPGKSFARIENLQNDVRRKYSSKLEWRKLRKETDVYDGDSLFLGEDSSAKVRLQKESVLELTPNTLVAFKGGSELDLRFGSFKGVISDSMRVKVGDQVLTLKGDNTEIEIDNRNGGAIKVLKGNLDLVGPKGSQKLSTNQDAQNLSRDLGQKRAKPLKAAAALPPVKIIDPTPQQKFEFVTDGNDKPFKSPKIKIRWQDPSLFGKYELELTEKNQLSKDSLIFESTDIEAQTPELKPGDYIVRVRPKGPPGGWSEPREFQVRYMIDPLPPAPIAKRLPPETILSDKKETLTYEWEKAPQAEKYDFEISSDPDFKNLISTQQTTDSFSHFTPEEIGPYFARARGISYNGRIGPYGSMGRTLVKVNRPEIENMQTVDVMAPANDSQPEPVPVDVKWSPIPYAKLYEVEASEDPNFEKSEKFVSADPTRKVDVKNPGKTFFRVRALASTGEPITGFSNPKTLDYIFKVPLVTPALVEPSASVTLFFQTARETPFWFEWKAIRQAKVYQVQVSNDSEFKKTLLVVETEKTRFLVKKPLPQGKLFWRVKAKSETEESPWSEPRALTVFAGRAPANQKGKK